MIISGFCEEETIIESSHDAILVLDLNTNVIICNSAVSNIYDHSKNEIVGKSLYNFIPRKYHNKFESYFTRATNGENVPDYECIRDKSNGSKINISVSLSPIIINDKIIGIVLVIKDVTEIKRGESWLNSIINSSHDAIIVLDFNANIIKCNNGVIDIYGYPPDVVQGKSIYEFIPIQYRNDFQFYFNKVKNGAIIDHYESVRIRKHKSKVYVSASLAPIINNDEIIGIVAIAKDFTHIKNLEQELLLKTLDLKLIKKIFDNALEGMIIINNTGIIQAANPSFESFTGYLTSELLGENINLLVSPNHKASYKKIFTKLQENGQWTGEVFIKNKKDIIKLYWVTINIVKNDITNEIMYVSVFNDLKERLRYEKKLKYDASHDFLTGLPNRAAFLMNLTDMLEDSQKNCGMAAICFIDLDGFKLINDTLGHDIGDTILKMVSARLKHTIRRTDFIARLGGDEFTLIIYDFKEEKNLRMIAENVIKIIKKPYQIKKHTVNIGASMGIAIYPYHSEDPIDLMKHADTAMYQAKRSGKGEYIIYS